MPRLKHNIHLLLLRAVAHLPYGALYVVSDIIYFFIYTLGVYRKDVVRTNLANAFPEKSASERRTIERRFYRHLCDCIVEDIKLLHVSARQLNERVEIRNAALFEELAADGGDIFALLGHYGNWEYVQTITWHYRQPEHSYIIYRPVKARSVDEIFLALRSRFPTEPLPQKDVYRTLLRDAAAGRQTVVAFIADQRPNSRSLNHWTTFLHQDTAYAVGAEQIAARINAHLIYLDMEKPRRGHYIITATRLTPSSDESEYPYTKAFLQRLEETIRRDPAYWLWTHKRWRRKRTEQPTTDKKQ